MNRRTTLLLTTALVTATLGCADRTFFGEPPTWPVEGPVTIPATYEPVKRDHVPSGDGVIETWTWDMLAPDGAPSTYRRRRPPAVVVLFSPDATQPVQQCGQYLHALYGGRDICVVGWNYPGIGSSSGPLDLARLLECSVDLFDYVDRAYRHAPIVAHGISLGAGPSLYLATERTVDGVLVDSPMRATHIPYQPEHGWWNLWIGSLILAGQVPAEYDVTQTARETSSDGALLVIHGDNNKHVPISHGLAVYNRWPYSNKRLMVVPDTGHYPDTFNVDVDRYRDEVDQLLQQVTPASRVRRPS